MRLELSAAPCSLGRQSTRQCLTCNSDSTLVSVKEHSNKKQLQTTANVSLFSCLHKLGSILLSLTGMLSEIFRILSPTFEKFFVSPFKRRNMKKLYYVQSRLRDHRVIHYHVRVNWSQQQLLVKWLVTSICTSARTDCFTWADWFQFSAIFCSSPNSYIFKMVKRLVTVIFVCIYLGSQSTKQISCSLAMHLQRSMLQPLNLKTHHAVLENALAQLLTDSNFCSAADARSDKMHEQAL